MKPPMAMTGTPVASWSGPAWLADETATSQVASPRLATRYCASASFVPAASPGKPPDRRAGSRRRTHAEGPVRRARGRIAAADRTCPSSRPCRSRAHQCRGQPDDERPAGDQLRACVAGDRRRRRPRSAAASATNSAPMPTPGSRSGVRSRTCSPHHAVPTSIAPRTIPASAVRDRSPQSSVMPAARERRGRRGDRDRVVRVGDAAHEREDGDVHDGPGAPQQVARRGRASVRGARKRATRPVTSPTAAAGSSQLISPAHWALNIRNGPVAPPNAAPAAAPAGHSPAGHSPAGAAALAEDPAQAVVAEDEVERGVARAAADVRPRAPPAPARRQPPTRTTRRGPRTAASGQAGQAPSEPAPRRHEVRQRERGQHEVRLQVLGEEREPDEGGREHGPPEPVVLEAADQRPGGGDQQQRQHRVGVVVAEHQGRRPA